MSESFTSVAASYRNRSGGSAPLYLLTAFLVLIIAIPSRLIFGPLGAAGTPAGVLGIVMAVLWGLHRLASPGGERQQPVCIAMYVSVGSILLSYIAAATRPIDATELSASDRGLLGVLGWLGVLLVAAYGLSSMVELDVLLRRLSTAGAVLASVGLAQFVTSMPLTNYIEIPGLRVNSDLVGVSDRAGLTRPAGTAIHPIEFGAALTIILPIAIHYALRDTHRSRFARWLPVATISIAIPISISRSAIVSAAVVLAFLLPTWGPALRRRAYVAIAAVLGSVYLLVPGLLGTIRNLFTGISEDSSAQSRTGSYTLAWDFFRRTPIFGRGYGTFLPSYRILDNQYLGLMIDTGLVGVAAVLGLFLTSIFTSARVRQLSPDPMVRGLAQSLAASVAAAACSLALYDGFAFPMAAGLLFFVIGCSAALRRLEPQTAYQG